MPKLKTVEPRDLYQSVTDRIVTALESGQAPWLRPWKTTGSGSALEPHNAFAGRVYSGLNWLILGCAPYEAQGWMTYRQAKELGAQVRGGEKGTQVVFWSFPVKVDEATGKKTTTPFARAYTVFNVEQIENLPEQLKAPPPPVPGDTSITAVAARLGADVRHGGDRAVYRVQPDYVQMPSFAAFKSQQAYDATLAHELTHWTGHPSRCARQFGKRFGDDAYAFEELVAEIGSAFVCARQGVAMEGLQHTEYLASWLKVLRADKRAIFTAASQAKKACEFLLGNERAEEGLAELEAAA